MVTERFRPAGGFEIPGLDPDYETYPKREPQTVEVVDREPVTVQPGSLLKVYRMRDGRLYAESGGEESEDCSDDIEEIQAPVGAGETLYFEWSAYISGSPEQNYAVCVHTPPHPVGGFQVIGRSVLGRYVGGAFGADSFNNPAGVFTGGVDGTLLGYSTVRVRGVLANGPQAGMLKLQLAPAEEPVAAQRAYTEWQVDIVMGQAPDPLEGILTFSLNEKTYSFNCATQVWVGNRSPANDPPSGYVGDLIGNNSARGYFRWYVVDFPVPILRPAHTEDQGEGLEWISDEPRATLEAALNAVATRITIDHGNWDKANTNANDTPYNGRDIGAVIGANKYNVAGSSAVHLDSVTHTTKAYVFPIDDKPLDEFA